jgi:hypothetical protein
MAHPEARQLPIYLTHNFVPFFWKALDRVHGIFSNDHYRTDVHRELDHDIFPRTWPVDDAGYAE